MTPRPSTTPPASLPPQDSSWEPGPSAEWVGPPTQWEPVQAETDPARRRERWLVVSVAVVAALVVAAGIALAVSPGGSGPPTAAPPPTVASTTATTQGGTHHATAPRHSGRRGSSGTSTTVPAPPSVAGGPPVISSVTPASGAAGQGIQIAGANFLSSNGQITATFNGQVAPTSCPAQNTCTVTVPPSTGETSAQITITTASGTSNAVTFNYS